MSDSNSQWGQLAEHDNEAAELWDSFSRLPDPGENAVLDAFCRRKNLTINGLIRFGTRLADDGVLAYAYDQAIKYRDMTTGRKWGRFGSEFPTMKILRRGTEPQSTVIVVEGETDAVRVSDHYENADVACQPSGALHVPQSYIEQLADYQQILVGLDDDEAGRGGLAKWQAARPDAVSFRPEGTGDWCEAEELPPLPAPEEPEVELPTLVPAGHMMELEVPPVPSYFSEDVVPVGGLVIAHGWAKSFKSFTMFDVLSKIAQCEPWCGFDPLEEPVPVAVVQFEIKWAYYRERIAHLREQATDQELFDQNFLTWTPLARPRLKAGDTKSEDMMLSTLSQAGVQVVLFDPIRRMAGEADLNAENEMRKMLGFFERLNDNGITVIATHHDNKEGAKVGGGSALNMTGSGSFAGDPDTIISIELPKGEKFDESTKRNLRFTLRNSPIISPKGMSITEDGVMQYQDEPWSAYVPEVTDEPGEDEPEI